MTPERWQTIQGIFTKALELEGASREAFLADACGDDGSMRREVDELLASDAAAPAAFIHPLAETPATVDRDAPTWNLTGALEDVADDTELPESIGAYRIVRTLGEGGMGVVYLAEQTAPVRRMVALKLIKWGMDTREIVARFAAERQTLAVMNHAGIARVYDAGATTDGRPYFAMEYVEGGVSIARYCDDRNLSVRRRLDLFLELCDAIQHAHQKGIIHRDIKPSNVLVGGDDERPTPKVIDFGIARALDAHSLEQSFYTETGRLVGTPGYMSPEQTEAGAAVVDTRSDIYSLGALLYELLVGALPIDGKTIRSGNLFEILRAVRELDPPTPSTRLSRETDAERERAAHRGTEPDVLRKQLRGDLDWITMKALEKDPARRYASASELAADVRRHIEHLPVLAGPPSVLYRLRKFFRRNRWQVAAAVAAAIVVILFVGVRWQLQAVESRRLLAAGRAEEERFLGLREERDEAARILRALEERQPGWVPAWNRQEELAARRTKRAAERAAEEAYNRVLVALYSALEAAPVFSSSRDDARRALEELYYLRWQEASERGAIALEPGFFKELITSLGLGTYRRELEQAGTLRLETDPPGATVYCFRFEEAGGHRVPLPYHPRRGVLARPALRVAAVALSHATFRAGDRLRSITAGARADEDRRAIETRADLAAALRDVAVGERVRVEVLRDGSATTLDWTPYPAAAQDTLFEAGTVLDFWHQFGFRFEGYPLELLADARLGATQSDSPLEVVLEEGSYLLVLRSEGRPDTRVPFVAPGDRGTTTVRLLAPEEIPDGFVHVPAGAVLCGGDPEAYLSLPAQRREVGDFLIGRTEVTLGKYLEFINSAKTLERLRDWDAGKSETWSVAPVLDWNDGVLRNLRPPVAPGEERIELIPRLGSYHLFVRGEDGRFRLSEEISDLTLDWPVLGVPVFAALEYADWLTERHEGRWRFRLPDDFEWEKAARGADRRRFVWGDDPIYSFCNSRLGSYRAELSGASDIEAVGLRPMDESVYGVLGLAGGAKEPVLNPEGDDYPPPFGRFCPIRGASWQSTDPRDHHIATRNRRFAEGVWMFVGFRLAASLP